MIAPGLDAAITGVGYTDFTRNSGRTVLDLASSACTEAIADAGLTHTEVDGIMCYHENDSALVRDVAAVLGLPGLVGTPMPWRAAITGVRSSPRPGLPPRVGWRVMSSCTGR